MVVRKMKRGDFDQYKILRKAGLEDHQKLTGEKFKISSKQIKKEFEGILDGKKRIILVVEKSRKIQGYIIGTLMKNAYQCIAYIDDLFVAKDSRKMGLGKNLVNKFSKWSKVKKATIIRLGVKINNKKAVNLYKKLGFKIKYYEMEKGQVGFS
tara:strand:+ start:1434 stop:1892 length:459 start_codon:yes stop_codon:yes gene_type:complete